jgi:hypothetical protein
VGTPKSGPRPLRLAPAPRGRAPASLRRPPPQELGYFNRARPPVARVPEPIQFGSLVGQAEYRLKLQQLYKELEVRPGRAQRGARLMLALSESGATLAAG